MSKIKKGVKTPSRRKFFKAAAATGAAAAATVAMPNIALGAPQTLKMQAAWPPGKPFRLCPTEDFTTRRITYMFNTNSNNPPRERERPKAIASQ